MLYVDEFGPLQNPSAGFLFCVHDIDPDAVTGESLVNRAHEASAGYVFDSSLTPDGPTNSGDTCMPALESSRVDHVDTRHLQTTQLFLVILTFI